MNEQIEYQIQVIRLKRIQELTNRLKLALQRERIPASTASGLYVLKLTQILFQQKILTS